MYNLFEKVDEKPTELRIQSVQTIMSIQNFTGELTEATKEDVQEEGSMSSLSKSKFLSSLSNNEVWSEVLLVFYEIFRYLEEASDRLTDTHVTKLCIDGMQRTKAFEEDLNFYLTSEWRLLYRTRECVVNYLTHLRHLEENNPTLLMVYIYHLYMGLLASGEMLEKEGKVVGKAILDSGGFAIMDFAEKSATQIKKELKDAMNNTADALDESTKSEMIEESKTVFKMNNELIQSMQRSPPGIWRKIITIFLMLGGIGLITYVFCNTLMHTLEIIA